MAKLVKDPSGVKGRWRLLDLDGRRVGAIWEKDPGYVLWYSLHNGGLADTIQEAQESIEADNELGECNALPPTNSEESDSGMCGSDKPDASSEGASSTDDIVNNMLARLTNA